MSWEQDRQKLARLWRTTPGLISNEDIAAFRRGTGIPIEDDSEALRKRLSRTSSIPSVDNTGTRESIKIARGQNDLPGEAYEALQAKSEK